MKNKLLGFLFLISVITSNSNIIPIEAGVNNILNFTYVPISKESLSFLFGNSSAKANSLQISLFTQSVNIALSLNESTNFNTGYNISFNKLPDWITYINRSIIAGVPPTSGVSNFTIQINISSNGVSTIQNVILQASRGILGNKKFKGQSSTQQNNLDLRTSLQINNLLNPLNPLSPYHPYSKFNHHGVNYGGNPGNFAHYYSRSQNIFHPNNINSPFNAAHPNSPFNPRNLNYPLSNVSNPNSSLYDSTLAKNPNLSYLLSPIIANSVYYQNSTNYIPKFGFMRLKDLSNLFYVTRQISNGFITNIILTTESLIQIQIQTSNTLTSNNVSPIKVSKTVVLGNMMNSIKSASRLSSFEYNSGSCGKQQNNQKTSC